ncbi:MAG: TolC family outer membrane protein [Magnetococcales bacterium]|nr:TolC family outer membrane protein [Magnetococcales bacterium]
MKRLSPPCGTLAAPPSSRHQAEDERRAPSTTPPLSPTLARLTLFLGLSCLALPNALEAQTLHEAVMTSIQTHPTVLAAQEEERVLRQRVFQAYAGYLPTVDFTISRGQERSRRDSLSAAPTRFHAMTVGQAGLTLSQPLFDGFQTKHDVEKARANHAALKHDVQYAMERITLETVESYIETLRADERLKLLGENIRRFEDIHQKMGEMLEIGTVTTVDVRQAKSRLDLARSDFEGSRGVLQTAVDRFNTAVGQSPSELTPPEITSTILPSSLDEAVNIAMEHHPTLLSAQATLDGKRADRKSGLSAFLPTVDLDLEWQKSDNSSGSKSHLQTGSAMVSLSYNLFNGWSDISQHKENIKLVDQSRRQLEESQRTVINGVRNAWQAMETAKNRMTHLKSYIEVNRSVTASYHEQFLLGERTLLDVLNSENELSTSRISMVDEKYNHLLSLFRLLNSMGILLETMIGGEVIKPATDTPPSNRPSMDGPTGPRPTTPQVTPKLLPTTSASLSKDVNGLANRQEELAEIYPLPLGPRMEALKERPPAKRERLRVEAEKHRAKQQPHTPILTSGDGDGEMPSTPASLTLHEEASWDLEIPLSLSPDLEPISALPALNNASVTGTSGGRGERVSPMNTTSEAVTETTAQLEAEPRRANHGWENLPEAPTSAPSNASGPEDVALSHPIQTPQSVEPPPAVADRQLLTRNRPLSMPTTPMSNAIRSMGIPGRKSAQIVAAPDVPFQENPPNIAPTATEERRQTPQNSAQHVALDAPSRVELEPVINAVRAPASEHQKSPESRNPRMAISAESNPQSSVTPSHINTSLEPRTDLPDGYTVHLTTLPPGAKEEADDLVSTLMFFGIPALEVITPMEKGGIGIGVAAGPFTRRQQAQRLMESLRLSGNPFPKMKSFGIGVSQHAEQEPPYASITAPKRTPNTVTTPPISDPHRYSVQVASFPLEQSKQALALLTKLRFKGYPAILKVWRRDGVEQLRVLVGPYDGLTEAKTAYRKIAGKKRNVSEMGLIRHRTPKTPKPAQRVAMMDGKG